ncbi:Radical SAM, Pyruvate-formate lyase-activating enzyme like [Acidisarcina polymorpha]|uniref:Radical SAM, Pyruvate-formate lyase-activating enzyme like n=1 Tax=Acidisarcina polymorpha TaxID=2211140 RepID=A0A2Z5FX61_9BACT|nr:radical SAM protein [Acidisarcina polymorpha]AXC11310.1 Radical SAM, Pyruvate-formate lyase-activating enzyme like [Acidisarcina polymorpha]
MAATSTSISRRMRAASRKVRELATVGHALAATDHVVMAQIVPMRFCNLSCAYCNEYDKVSDPVPLEEMLRRIDHLARLGTSIITISGGEPLTHPDLDQIIARIRHHGRIAGMITNGYFLMPDRIKRLNEAGLDHMQISIDNVQPDEISKKSLKVLDKKLEFLAEYADFHVNINSVVGGGIKNPQDALTIGRRALGLGFTSTIGIIHDGDGQLKPLQDEERRVYFEMRGMKKENYSRFNHFQEAIANGEPNQWRCRAGSRYLYICEDGLVHYCSQQRGWPGVPLAEYTREDLKREFLTEKTCAPNCTISCVHQISYIDHWRAPQTRQVSPGLEGTVAELVNIQL